MSNAVTVAESFVALESVMASLLVGLVLCGLTAPRIGVDRRCVRWFWCGMLGSFAAILSLLFAIT